MPIRSDRRIVLGHGRARISGRVVGDRLVGEWTHETTARGSTSQLTWDLGDEGLPKDLLRDPEALIAAAMKLTSRVPRKRATSAPAPRAIPAKRATSAAAKRATSAAAKRKPRTPKRR